MAIIAPSSAFAAENCIVDSNTIEERFPDSVFASKAAQSFDASAYVVLTAIDVAGLRQLRVQRASN
jgi:hypothetical protein